MNMKPFAVEEWMNKWEKGAKYNIAETCTDSLSADELFELTGEDKEAFFKEFSSRRLTYGHVEGHPGFKKGVCGLYESIKPEHVIPVHGASGANHLVFYSLVNPGDRVISIMPTYQQLYAIPQSFGADVKIVKLKKENGYLPDLEELEHLAVPGTKLICINNPNNPTGALMSSGMLRQIVRIAEKAGAYLLCDEVYRHLSQEDDACDSIADLYEKGISVSSMSKVFSLAGLRLGWIACRDMGVIRECLSHRDYSLISCGMFDEALADTALRHSEILLERSRGIVRENLRILDDWVQREKHISYVRPKAGTTALLFYDLELSSYEFCEEMYHKTGAFVTPGDCFEEPKSMRIGYACKGQELERGLAAVSEYILMKTGS